MLAAPRIFRSRRLWCAVVGLLAPAISVQNAGAQAIKTDSGSHAAAATPASLLFRNPDLPLAKRVADLVSRLTLEEKVGLLETTSMPVPRLGIPAYNWRNEALHGVGRDGIATVYPQVIGLAASWDDSLVHAVAAQVSDEGRAKYRARFDSTAAEAPNNSGITFFTPNINIFRDPRWGRGQETYGEDPFMTARMGSAFVRGLQGDDSTYWETSGTAKHFVAHSGPDAEREHFEAQVSPYDLTDTYLPHFEALVREAHVAVVMSAYSGVNGTPMSANRALLQDVLRSKWGFTGPVVSDCGAVFLLHDGHHLATSNEQAGVLAINAGVDLDCGDDIYRDSLPDAVHKGLVTKGRIDTAVMRVMTVRFKLGLFDPPARVRYASITPADNDTPEHRKLALESAERTMVLLRNEAIRGKPLLPLSLSKGATIAIIGPVARDTSVLYGNYNGISSAPVTLYDGIQRRAAEAGITVRSAPGTNLAGTDTSGFARAIAAARSATVVIMALGITPGMGGEQKDLETPNIPAGQEQLLERIVATGKPVILVLTTGSSLSAVWAATHVPAILLAWFPGEEGGTAVANTLFGANNPGGHLPITFYRGTRDLPPYDNYDMRASPGRTYRYFKGTPLYPFGYGLSYTTFQYHGLHLPTTPVTAGDSLPLSVFVKNTGTRRGDAVIEVYVTKTLPTDVGRYGRPTRPIRSLAAYQRVTLAAGQSRKVTLVLRPAALSTVSESGKRMVQAGQFLVAVGGGQPDAQNRYASTAAGVTGQLHVVGSTVEIP